MADCWTDLYHFWIFRGAGGVKFVYFWIWVTKNVEKVDARTCCSRNTVDAAIGGKNYLAAVTRKFLASPPLLPGLIFGKTQKSFFPQ